MVNVKRPLWFLFVAVLFAIALSLGLPGCGDEELPPRLLSDCSDDPPPPPEIPSAGLKGIVLRIDTKCYFQIDHLHSRRFDWSGFVQQYGNVNPRIRIKVAINERGTVDSVFGIRDGGHPAAANLIINAVRRWQFEGGCLMGVILYEFNTKLSRLNIDYLDLKPAPGFEQCEVVIERMHRVIYGADLGVKIRDLDW